MSVIALVRQRINRMRRGIPFSISGFYPLGSRASVQQAMSRLAKEGMIVRVIEDFTRDRNHSRIFLPSRS